MLELSLSTHYLSVENLKIRAVQSSPLAEFVDSRHEHVAYEAFYVSGFGVKVHIEGMRYQIVFT